MPHIRLLEREYQRRVEKNPRYSRRAYANFLGLHPSALSRFLAGKWELTPSAGVQIAKKLQLSKDERCGFLRSILHARHEKEYLRFGALIDCPDLQLNHALPE